MATNVTLNLNYLGSQYPKGWNYNSIDHGKGASFTSEDSEYRFYQPKWTVNSNGTYTATLYQEHVRGAATDDNATVICLFDATGLLTDVSGSWTAGSDKPITIKDMLVADAIIASAAAITTAETLGAAIPIAMAAIGAVSTATKVINTFGKTVARLSDDGGRLNFLAVVGHNINKVCSSIVSTQLPAFTNKLYVDPNAFAKVMGSSFSEESGQAMEYSEKNPVTLDSSKYRTWQPDSSVAQQNVAILVSTKIDHVRRPQKDDHVVLILEYNQLFTLISALAVLKIEGHDPICTDQVTSGDIIGNLCNLIKSSMQAQDSYDSSGRQYLPQVIQQNANAIAKSLGAH